MNNRNKIDALIIQLWLELRDLSDTPLNMTAEDLELWGVVTNHPAIQTRLDQALNAHTIYDLN